MSLATLKPPTGLWAFVRELQAYAWPKLRSAEPPHPVDALTTKAVRHRNLPEEELAQIDALRLRIGPAFAAAMARSVLEAKARSAYR
jgi:hypothetical protein